MKIETLAVHAGHAIDPATGAVAAPIYLSTTFERDVDGARLPVYLFQEHERLAPIAGWIAILTIGVVGGTAIGERVLHRVPERWFRRIVASTLLILGSVMLVRALQ